MNQNVSFFSLLDENIKSVTDVTYETVFDGHCSTLFLEKWQYVFELVKEVLVCQYAGQLPVLTAIIFCHLYADYAKLENLATELSSLCILLH